MMGVGKVEKGTRRPRSTGGGDPDFCVAGVKYLCIALSHGKRPPIEPLPFRLRYVV